MFYRETNHESAQIYYSDQLSCYFHCPVKFKFLDNTTPEAINKEAGEFGEENYLLFFRKWNYDFVVIQHVGHCTDWAILAYILFIYLLIYDSIERCLYKCM